MVSIKEEKGKFILFWTVFTVLLFQKEGRLGYIKCCMQSAIPTTENCNM